MRDDPGGADRKTPISVSELNRRARGLLESGLARVWIEGEISNLARPASGHLYFSLKDPSAQIRCAWFRQRQRGQARGLANGDKMLALGRVSIYEPRGDYQLIVEQVEPAGEGELRRRFELLKKKLDAEGLFAAGAKRPLPALPRRIGVITSPSGAAVRDVITVLRRRFPAIPVIIYPAAVQGAYAVPEITAALATAAARAECDVLIVGRGGGSLEDLWAFNEEAVARAIRQSPIPVISAVGHEVDVTIADLVADWRAPTPSGAAEIAVPEQAEWRRSVAQTLARLTSLMRRTLEDQFQSVDWLNRRLAASSPSARLKQQAERLAATQRAMLAAIRHDLLLRNRRVDSSRARLLQRSPRHRIERAVIEMAALRRRLLGAGTATLQRLRSRFDFAIRSLDAVSPLATLDRGYAIVTEADSGKLITNASKVTTGTTIVARLGVGRLRARVEQTRDDSDAD
jgi:exodeoxyribonuclease VII large subunit